MREPTASVVSVAGAAVGIVGVLGLMLRILLAGRRDRDAA